MCLSVKMLHFHSKNYGFGKPNSENDNFSLLRHRHGQVPQQAADQMHVQPGRIQRHHRESMPRDMHAQGERESQLPADGVQGKRTDRLFSFRAFHRSRISRAGEENARNSLSGTKRLSKCGRRSRRKRISFDSIPLQTEQNHPFFSNS